MIGNIEPTVNYIKGFVVAIIGFIPILGDIIGFLDHAIDPFITMIVENFLPSIDAYTKIIDKNFEEGFTILASTMGNFSKMASSSEATRKMLDNLVPFINKGIGGLTTATDVSVKNEFHKYIKYAQKCG